MRVNIISECLAPLGMTLGGASFAAIETGILAGSTGFAAGILSYPAFEVGVVVGTTINVQIVEPYTNPCKKESLNELR